MPPTPRPLLALLVTGALCSCLGLPWLISAISTTYAARTEADASLTAARATGDRTQLRAALLTALEHRTPDERADLLVELAAVEVADDLPSAADHLTEALRLRPDVEIPAGVVDLVDAHTPAVREAWLAARLASHAVTRVPHADLIWLARADRPPREGELTLLLNALTPPIGDRPFRLDLVQRLTDSHGVYERKVWLARVWRDAEGQSHQALPAELPMNPAEEEALITALGAHPLTWWWHRAESDRAAIDRLDELARTLPLDDLEAFLCAEDLVISEPGEDSIHLHPEVLHAAPGRVIDTLADRFSPGLLRRVLASQSPRTLIGHALHDEQERRRDAP
jgi:hypothetical protein